MTKLKQKAREAANEMAYATFTGEPNQARVNQWRAKIIARHFQGWQPNARLREAADILSTYLLKFGEAVVAGHAKATDINLPVLLPMARGLREALAAVPEPQPSERERLLLAVLEAARRADIVLRGQPDPPLGTRQELETAIRAYDEARGQA